MSPSRGCKLFRQRGIIALLLSDSVGVSGGGQRVESNGIGWIFLSTFANGGKKRKGTLAGEPL